MIAVKHQRPAAGIAPDASNVKLRNELHNVSISDGRDRFVEGVVRVRGIDAFVAGRGLRIEQRDPVAVVVQTSTGVQRHALPRYDAFPSVAAAIAGPALFLATKRFFRKGRRR
jgi:hypothetical protein